MASSLGKTGEGCDGELVQSTCVVLFSLLVVVEVPFSAFSQSLSR